MHEPIPDDDRAHRTPPAIARNTNFNLVTIEEACRILGVRRSSLYRLMRDGDLSFVLILRRKRLVRVRDLEALIDRRSRSSVFLSVWNHRKKTR